MITVTIAKIVCIESSTAQYMYILFHKTTLAVRVKMFSSAYEEEKESKSLDEHIDVPFRRNITIVRMVELRLIYWFLYPIGKVLDFMLFVQWCFVTRSLCSYCITFIVARFNLLHMNFTWFKCEIYKCKNELVMKGFGPHFLQNIKQTNRRNGKNFFRFSKNGVEKEVI